MVSARGLPDLRRTPSWASQVPVRSFRARRPQSPRRVPAVLAVMSSRRILASPKLTGWPLPKSNEAESGSLPLRLTRSPSGASPSAVARCRCPVGYMFTTHSHDSLLPAARAAKLAWRTSSRQSYFAASGFSVGDPNMLWFTTCRAMMSFKQAVYVYPVKSVG